MRRDLRCVVQVGFAFFLVFSAFNSQGFIEIAILRNLAQAHPESGFTFESGYYSLAIIYFVFTLSNLIAPPIINIVGSKWAQVIGATCYTLFMLSFLFLSPWLLYIFSAVLGFGAALLWTGNGVYLVEFSREGKMGRNSGILWAMLQTSLIAGALFLFFILSQSDLVSSYKLVYTVFSAVAAIGTFVLVLLPASPPLAVLTDGLNDRLIEDSSEGDDDADERLLTDVPRTWKEDFTHTFSLMKSPVMWSLSVCFLYSGIETTFYTGVYSACLSASTALNKGSETIIPFNSFCMGAGQIIGGLSFGMGASCQRVSRSMIIILGTIMHLAAFFLAFINIPMDAPLHKTPSSAYIDPSLTIALVTGFLLGLADSCWNTQIYSLLGSLYKRDSSSAFALFKFFQSGAACVSFYYGSILLLHWQLLILSLGAAAAALCFFVAQNESDRISTELTNNTDELS